MNRAAQELGRLGGLKTSRAKRRAARRNWQRAVKALAKKRKARHQ